MSHIRRIPLPEPEPERFQRIVLEELTELWRMLETVSLRVAVLEGNRPDDRPLTPPELGS